MISHRNKTSQIGPAPSTNNRSSKTRNNPIHNKQKAYIIKPQMRKFEKEKKKKKPLVSDWTRNQISNHGSTETKAMSYDRDWRSQTARRSGRQQRWERGPCQGTNGWNQVGPSGWWDRWHRRAIGGRRLRRREWEGGWWGGEEASKWTIGKTTKVVMAGEGPGGGGSACCWVEREKERESWPTCSELTFKAKLRTGKPTKAAV